MINLKLFKDFVNENYYKNPYNPDEIFDDEIIISKPNKDYNWMKGNQDVTLEELKTTLIGKTISFYGKSGKKYEFYKCVDVKLEYDEFITVMGDEGDSMEDFPSQFVLKVYKKGLEINNQNIDKNNKYEIGNYGYTKYDRDIVLYNNDKIIGIQVDNTKPIKIERK